MIVAGVLIVLHDFAFGGKISSQHVDQLAYQCQAFGVQAQEPMYMAGWVDGYREYLIRMNGSECCGTK